MPNHGSRGERGELRDWLTARLDGQLEGSGRGAEPEEADEAPTPSTTIARTVPRRAAEPGPPAVRRPDRRPPAAPVTRHDEEDPADPETVQATDFSLEDHADPRTVRIHRMPLSFIGEAVIDPATVRLDSEEATRWRAEASIDEVPLLARAPTPTPAPGHRLDRVQAPAATPVPAEPTHPEWLTLFGTALLGGVLGLVVVAIWAWLVHG